MAHTKEFQYVALKSSNKVVQNYVLLNLEKRGLFHYVAVNINDFEICAIEFYQVKSHFQAGFKK